jgi:hypothetical protein
MMESVNISIALFPCTANTNSNSCIANSDSCIVLFDSNHNLVMSNIMCLPNHLPSARVAELERANEGYQARVKRTTWRVLINMIEERLFLSRSFGLGQLDLNDCGLHAVSLEHLLGAMKSWAEGRGEASILLRASFRSDEELGGGER